MNYDRVIDIPKISCQYLEEPQLCFADGQQHIDPKSGISNFGPKSYSPRKRHPSQVRVGFIGSAETIEATKQWMERSAEGVLGNSKHPNFPGFKKEQGFFSELVFDDDWIGQLNRSEIETVLKIRLARDAVRSTASIASLRQLN